MAYLVDNMEMPEPATFRGSNLTMDDEHYGPTPSTSAATTSQGARRKTANGNGVDQGADSTYVSFSNPGPRGYPDELPDSPEVDLHLDPTHHQEIQSMYSQYHASMETEETVKCVVTSVLFLAIIAMVLIIAFVANPMMS